MFTFENAFLFPTFLSTPAPLFRQKPTGFAFYSPPTKKTPRNYAEKPSQSHEIARKPSTRPPRGGFWVKFSSRGLQGSDQNRKKRPFPAPLAETHREGGERAQKAEDSGVLVLADSEEEGLQGLSVKGDQGVEVVPLPRDGDVGQEQDHDSDKPRAESPVPADGGEDQ